MVDGALVGQRFVLDCGSVWELATLCLYFFSVSPGMMFTPGVGGMPGSLHGSLGASAALLHSSSRGGSHVGAVCYLLYLCSLISQISKEVWIF